MDLLKIEDRFDQLRRRSGFWLAPLLFGLTLLITNGRLSPAGSRLSAILAAVVVLWITEAMPLPVTALLASCMCVVLGVGPAKAVLAPYADPIIFLFIGSFMLARAMAKHSLDRRFAVAVLSLPWVEARPGRVLFAIGAVTVLISMWVSNTATTAMMLPVALGLLRAMEGGAPIRNHRNTSAYATGMMLMLAYGACVGGIGTPVGSPPNLITIGLIRKLTGVEIGFFQWMLLCVPLVAVMYAVLFTLLRWLHPPTNRSSAETDLAGHLVQLRAKLGGWTRGQINTVTAFGVAIVLWLMPGVLGMMLGGEHPLARVADLHLPEAVIAILAASLLFVLPTDWRKWEFTLEWQEASQIDWGTILLFGGGLSLGGLMFATGVADAFGCWLVRLTGAHSLWGLTAIAIVLGIVVSETTSNTASASMVIPVVIVLAQNAGANPVPPALGACLGASYGFMLPVSTPPNAVVYGSGLVPIMKMIRAGVLFDVCGFVTIWIGLRLLCPLFGWR